MSDGASNEVTRSVSSLLVPGSVRRGLEALL
jgi:hypothetical protein